MRHCHPCQNASCQPLPHMARNQETSRGPRSAGPSCSHSQVSGVRRHSARKRAASNMACTCVQQPVQDLAVSGSVGRSAATTRKVGSGQYAPPSPMIVQSCATCRHKSKHTVAGYYMSSLLCSLTCLYLSRCRLPCRTALCHGTTGLCPYPLTVATPFCNCPEYQSQPGALEYTGCGKADTVTHQLVELHRRPEVDTGGEALREDVARIVPAVLRPAPQLHLKVSELASCPAGRSDAPRPASLEQGSDCDVLFNITMPHGSKVSTAVWQQLLIAQRWNCNQRLT